eukprot:7586300-Heterocapsa_arctica.AAC.1
MKILCGARLARFDLLRAVGALATNIIKWDSRRSVGDSAELLQLTLYSDADFAGCPESAKSTSGPSTFFPLNAISKKQTCVSRYTPEAEIVAADLALRTEGLPTLQLGYRHAATDEAK